MLESTEKLEDVKSWIEEKGLPTDNMYEYFADGMAIASMLKEHHPMLVDMNTYTPHTSVKRRLANWKALNLNVLNVLNIKLSRESIENIAKAQPGAIEKLLEKIMQLELIAQDKDDVFTLGEYDVITIQGEGNESVKLIAFDKYEKAVKAVEYKESLVAAEQRKSRHLQNLMKLREERIAELRAQLAEYSE